MHARGDGQVVDGGSLVPAGCERMRQDQAADQGPLQWVRFFTPDAVHKDLGRVCLGTGVQRGTPPVVGPRTVDRHVAVVVTADGGWYRHGRGERTAVTAPALLWLVPRGRAPLRPRARRRLGRDVRGMHRHGDGDRHQTRLHHGGPPVVPLVSAEDRGAFLALSVDDHAARHGTCQGRRIDPGRCEEDPSESGFRSRGSRSGRSDAGLRDGRSLDADAEVRGRLTRARAAAVGGLRPAVHPRS